MLFGFSHFIRNFCCVHKPGNISLWAHTPIRTKLSPTGVFSATSDRRYATCRIAKIAFPTLALQTTSYEMSAAEEYGPRHHQCTERRFGASLTEAVNPHEANATSFITPPRGLPWPLGCVCKIIHPYPALYHFTHTP